MITPSDLILVDTSIWIQFLRLPGSGEAIQLRRLLAQDRVATTGIVLVEILRGANSRSRFDALEQLLETIHFFETGRAVWERVAKLAFTMKEQGSTIMLPDLIIGSVAIEHGCRLYTRDTDFQRVPGLELYEPQSPQS